MQTFSPSERSGPPSDLDGAVPMLLQRMDNQIPWEVPGTPEAPSVAARRTFSRDAARLFAGTSLEG